MSNEMVALLFDHMSHGKDEQQADQECKKKVTDLQ